MAAPVMELPVQALSSSDLPYELTFDNHVAGNLTPSKYVPPCLDMGPNTDLSNQSSAEETQRFFVKFMVINLFVDMMIAYQHDHKMAANDIKNIFKTSFMQNEGYKEYYDCIVLSIFSMILNHKDSASDHRVLASTNFPQQSLFYFQILSKTLSDLKEASPTGMTPEKLQSFVDNKIVEYVSKYDFNTSGAGKLMYSLVKLSVFL